MRSELDSMQASVRFALGIGVVALLCPVMAEGQSPSGNLNSLRVGVAKINFDAGSGELMGDFTPPGITVDAANAATLGLVLGRTFAQHYVLQFAVGVPPTFAVNGAGTAEGIGEIGSTRAWFPALVGLYSLRVNERISGYVGAGVSYTFFSDAKTTAAYDDEFGGSSEVTLQSHVGPVVKMGAEIDLTVKWFLDFSYARYWISSQARVTTETPGLGPIERSISVNLDPNVLSAFIGIRF